MSENKTEADLPTERYFTVVYKLTEANVAKYLNNRDWVTYVYADSMAELASLKELTAQAPNQPGGFDAGDMASAAAQGYRDGWTAAQADSVPAVDEAYKQVLRSKNCMQCCVGYMLGLPLESVPDFAADGGWDRFASFAESQGYAAVMLPGNPEFEADYLASGTTTRGTSHMVVMNDGKLVHDPHPSNAGLVEVQCVWLLAKKAGPQWHHDGRAAFEANVSFERDGTDYADMTASLLWHGWKLRASRASADSVLEDAGRLDWLAKSDWYVGPGDFYCGEGGGLYDCDDKNTGAAELRAAIDAARAAQKEGAL